MSSPPPTADTIYALSSAAGRAGVAVVRLSGAEAGAALRTLAGRLPPARTAALRKIRTPDSGDLIDDGLILWFPAPHSFTGEDCAEFQIHGGRAVIAALLDALGRLPGLRLAEPGEFARRAFENGKLDLTAAEGLADLIDAETEAQRRQAVAQADGALAGIYEDWREQLVEALALQEAGIDFSDEEDIAEDASAQAEDRSRSLLAAIQAHLNDGHRGEILRDGFRVVIAGPPNAGKSSLLNALARRDVAIVSADAGTTRDVIEVRLDLGGLPIIISDTAGLRAAPGGVEQEGMRRALDRARRADLVIWLQDVTAPATDLPRELASPLAPGSPAAPLLRIANKSDLICGDQTGSGDAADLHISVATEEGLPALTDRLSAIAAARIGASDAAMPTLTRHRHREQLEHCVAALESYLAGDAGDLELRAEDLRQAAAALGRITGRIDVEDVLGQIFSSFCVGK